MTEISDTLIQRTSHLLDMQKHCVILYKKVSIDINELHVQIGIQLYDIIRDLLLNDCTCTFNGNGVIFIKSGLKIMVLNHSSILINHSAFKRNDEESYKGKISIHEFIIKRQFNKVLNDAFNIFPSEIHCAPFKST